MTINFSNPIEFKALPATLPSRGKIAGLGDSITAAMSTTQAAAYLMNASGFLAWVPFLTRQKVFTHPTLNFGVQSETTAQILARVSNAVDSGAGICTVLAGTNDVVTSSTVAEITANLEAIYDALAAAGIVIIAVLILPRGNITSAQRGKLYQVNAWIREQRYSRTNFYVADATIDIADPANGGPLASMMHDTYLHPNAAGAYVIARRVAAIVDTILGGPTQSFGDALDIYSATDNPIGNLLSNGIMAGTSGTLTATGASGSLATGWVSTGATMATGQTATFSKVTQSDGRTFQQIEFAGTLTAGTSKYLDVSLSATAANVSPGDVLEAVLEVEIDSGHSNRVPPCLVNYVNGASAFSSSTFGTDFTRTLLAGAYSGILKTPRFTVPAGGVSGCGIYLRLGSINSVTSAPMIIRFGGAELRKIV